MAGFDRVYVERMFSPESGQVVPNHFIIHTPEGGYFQSYDTVIAFVSDTGEVTLDKRHWKSTREMSVYRSQFLGESTEETEEHIQSGYYTLADLNGEG